MLYGIQSGIKSSLCIDLMCYHFEFVRSSVVAVVKGTLEKIFEWQLWNVNETIFNHQK